jgi:hypothetical protein
MQVMNGNQTGNRRQKLVARRQSVRAPLTALRLCRGAEEPLRERVP